MKRSLLFYCAILAFTLFLSSEMQAQTIQILSIGKTDETCSDTDDGTITISITGGTKPYVYHINHGIDNRNSIETNDTVYTFTNVWATSWIVFVEDDLNIADFGGILVSEPAVISISSAVVTPISCTGFGDGKITVIATGETGSYNFTLNPGAIGNITGIFIGLSPNTYSVTVNDANTCNTSAVTVPLTVSNPLPISVNSASATDMTCNNLANGIINVSGAGGTGDYVYTLNPGAIAVNGSGNFTGLNTGVYTVNITDANTCPSINTAALTINEPQAVVINSQTSTNANCNNADDGTISVTASGGSGVFSFTLMPGSVTNGNGLFTNIAPGTYTVSVLDSKGCGPVVSGNLVITEPPALAIGIVSSANITCHNNNDGKITVLASGGTPGYSYTLNPGAVNNGTEIFNGLVAGNYTVSVIDSKGCPPVSTAAVIISNPAVISISSQSSTNVTCIGATNGTITVVATGGTGSRHYTLTPGAVSNTSGSFTGLGPGTYSVSITDDNGCPAAVSVPIIITQPSVLSISSQTSTDINCFGINTGTVTVSATGGTVPLTYVLNPGGVNNLTGAFTNLSANIYTVTITDANGCPSIASVPLTVAQPVALSISNVTFSVITCNGNNDGHIQVTAAGGTPAYSYTLNPGAVNNGTGIFASLSPASYTVSVSDAKGCGPVANPPINITEPAVISISSQSSTNVTCNGASNGTITIVATGGTGSKHYTLTPGAVINTSGSFNGLGPGTYSVSITDDNGCPAAVSAPIIITQPLVLSISSQTSTDINCFGINTGMVTVSATGGTAPLSYVLNPGGVNNLTGVFTNLSANIYTVTITDANGCPSIASVPLTVAQPAALRISNVTFSVITCNGIDDGHIQVTAAGGTPAYSYTLNPGAVNNGTGIFASLSPASYTVSVSDTKGCAPVATSPINITEPAVISISSQSSTNISCNGAGDGTINVVGTGGTGSLQYTLKPGEISNATGIFNNLTANTYTVTVNDANTCDPKVTGNIIITEPAIINATIDGSSLLSLACFDNSNGTINISVNGGTFPFLFSWTGPLGFTSSDEDISGLRAGVYSLVITDSKACSKNFPVLATIVEPTLLTSSVVKTDITCNGLTNGTVTISPLGGTIPYTYSRVPFPYQGSNVFSGLTKGNHSFNTKDANGCISNNNITINEPQKLKIPNELRIDNNECFGDSLGEIRILSVSGGISPYEYSIDSGLNFNPTGVFQNLPAGSYQTTVRDANGCLKNGNLNLISQPTKIFITSYSQVDVTECFGNSNGQITIEGAGGTGDISYSLDGIENNSSGIFPSVGGGDHLITLIDSKACSIDTSVNLPQPSEQIFSGLTITDVTGCKGDSTGELNAVATGGAGSYNYSFNGGAFQYSGNFIGLSAESYTLSVRDTNMCVKDTIININEPALISIQSQTSVNATCTSANNGSISITAAGGTAPYSFVLNPGAIVTNNTGSFVSLVPGTYWVAVNDNPGCGIVNTDTLAITEPAPNVRDSVSSKGISCAGSNNAEIHIYSSGGTSPYTYSNDDGSSFGNSSDFTGLASGTYRLRLIDALGCILNLDTLSFADPSAITMVSETRLDIVSCNNDSVGEVDFVVSGGTGSTEYSMDLLNWQVSGHFTGLKAGSYTVMARDQNFCALSSSSLTINAPAAIIADITTTPDLNEFNRGTISIANASGGIGTLVFSITGPAGAFSAQTSYTGLNAGTYPVAIRDDNNCTFEQDAVVTLIPALAVTVTLTNSTCNGDNDASITMANSNGTPLIEYSIDDSTSWVSNGNFAGLSPGTYYIFVRDGQSRYFQDTVLLTEPLAINIFGNITPSTCASNSGDGAIRLTVNGGNSPYTFLWTSGEDSQDLTDLKEGTYSLTVTDSKSCSSEKSFVLPATTTVVADAGPDTTLCYGEAFILNGQGGSVMSWSPTEGLSNPSISNPVVSITADASYILTVVGFSDCFDTDTINIIVRPEVSLNAGNDTTVITGQEVSLVATGGTFASYSWRPAKGLSTPDQATTLAHPQVNTNFIITALTELGCTESDTVMVRIIERLNVYDVFSPNNGDDKNNYFDIENASMYPKILVEVYTRWGEKLFSSTGYSDEQRWDGTFKGKDVPMGTYYYVIVPYHGAEAITGPLTIVR